MTKVVKRATIADLAIAQFDMNHTCRKESCGKNFDSKQGRNTHEGMMHDIEFEEDDKSTRSMSNKEIKKEVDRVVEKCGEPLTAKEFSSISKISAATVGRRFGESESFSRSLLLLGYEPAQIKAKKEELLEEIRALYSDFDKVTTDLMDEEGKFDSMTYIRRFGSWSKAVVEAGFEKPTKGVRKENHPHWKGGNGDWRGSNWKSVREKIRKRDSHQCRTCGKEAQYRRGKSTAVHHIKSFQEFEDYKEANKSENLVLLCHECHNKYEGKLPNLSVDEWVKSVKEL